MKKKILYGFILLVVLILVYFISLQPSHNRNWDDNASKLPSVEVNGDKITINNIRDWRYDDKTEISKDWISKSFDLSKISGVWLVQEPFDKWDGVAHTMLVFDFENSKPIVLSVEARKEKSETYDAWLGLIKKYELIYLWGTEEDMVARRIINQKHDLYMFPLDINLDYAKLLFLDLVKTTNSIYEKPRFYNTFTQNCTNVFAYSANRAEPGTAPWHISRLLPGYADEFLFEQGYIKSDKTLPEIKNIYYINDIVKGIKDYANFSETLREEIKKKEN